MKSCLIVIQNLTRSGSPQTFLHVIELLNKKGFTIDVFVYAVRDKNVDLFFYNKYKKICRNIFIGKMKLNGLSYKFFPFIKFSKIKSIINKNRYNLVISNNIYFMADCAAHKNKLSNQKLIYYALGNVNIQSKFALIRKKERFVRKYIKDIDAYIALSSLAVPKDDITPEGRVYMLMDYPNEYFPDIVKKPNSEGTVLGQIGYYCSNKNQLFSLSVLKELIERGQKAHLLFVGFRLSEEPNYYDEMIEFIDKYSLASAVTFLPSDYDKKKLFEQIHILLLPSLFEGLSLTLLEAQFSNTYCIASDSVPRDVDFGLCTYSRLIEEEWIKSINDIKDKNMIRPSHIYGKDEFENSLSKIVDAVMNDKKI